MMPRDPKWEYSAGRSVQRHTLAASSRTPSKGVGSRPPVLWAARVSAASAMAAVSAVTREARRLRCHPWDRLYDASELVGASS